MREELCYLDKEIDKLQINVNHFDIESDYNNKQNTELTPKTTINNNNNNNKENIPKINN